MVYLSISSRILLNIEALNMTENVGNYVRHRRAPIVIPTEHGYILRYVPVISGESIAHAYQEILAKLSSEAGLPVCRLCRIGVFLKHTDNNVFSQSGIPKPKDPKDPVEVEELIVKSCTVEDIGGFLYTDATLKRTSRFMTGYMIPAIDTVKSSAAEAQFHVRYDPRVASQRESQQMIYNVEVGSAVYTVNMALDIDGIGVSSLSLEEGKPKKLVSDEERIKRIDAALKSLSILLLNQLFGAKRSRFMPQWRIMSMVALVSDPITINAMPGHSRTYIRETAETASTILRIMNTGSAGVKAGASMAYYAAEPVEEPGAHDNLEIVKAETPANLFEKIIGKVHEIMEKRR